MGILHFGFVSLHFLPFCPFGGQLLESILQVAKNGPFAQCPYNGFTSAMTGSILQFLAFLGLHFFAFLVLAFGFASGAKA